MTETIYELARRDMPLYGCGHIHAALTAGEQATARVAELEAAQKWASEHREALERNWEALAEAARRERDEWRQRAGCSGSCDLACCDQDCDNTGVDDTGVSAWDQVDALRAQVATLTRERDDELRAANEWRARTVRHLKRCRGLRERAEKAESREKVLREALAAEFWYRAWEQAFMRAPARRAASRQERWRKALARVEAARAALASDPDAAAVDAMSPEEIDRFVRVAGIDPDSELARAMKAIRTAKTTALASEAAPEARCSRLRCHGLSDHAPEDCHAAPEAAGKPTEPQAQALGRRGLAFAVRTFGPGAGSRLERATRLAEEAIELLQAEGGSERLSAALVARAYARPAGQPEKEIAQVGVTTLSYCAAAGVDLLALSAQELDRIEALPPEHWRERHATKAAAGTTTTEAAGTGEALRPEVLAFARVMSAKLDGHNHDRGEHGWRTATPEQLLAWLDRYLNRLRGYWKWSPADLLAQAANVANLAMMVADVCGDREPAPAPETTKEDRHE